MSDIRHGFHYKGYHVRFGAYFTHPCAHGYDKRAFRVTVTKAGGHKYRYTSGGLNGKKWLASMIKKDIEAWSKPSIVLPAPPSRRIANE